MTVEHTIADKSIYHKNLMPVTYVIGDVAGSIESPVYAILKMNKALAKLDTQQFGGDGSPLKIYNSHMPFTDNAAVASNGTANGTSPLKSFATSAWRSPRCWC